MYRGLIAAAGLSTRLQDLGDKRNKVLLDLGGETVLGIILRNFDQAGVSRPLVVVGSDGLAVRNAAESAKAECLYNPFFQDYGILSSIWQARAALEGQPFLFTTGDHYFSSQRLPALLADQKEADVLVDVELKTCDDEDMKVYLNRNGKLRTITKTMLPGPVLGEFTGMVRFSAEGGKQLFTTLENYVWQNGIQGYLADVLCAAHRKWELAFHLSTDHHRIEIDFPCDLVRARQLFAREKRQPRQVG
jgi:L-glutamine-phosphate cytidylyltransferase